MQQEVLKPPFKSPLHEMSQTTRTCFWNDSASIAELTYSMEHGAVGATCNPVIAMAVIRKELDRWVPVIRKLIEEHTTATEDELGWRLVEEVSQHAAALLMPIFAAENGRNGRLSIQTDPRLYRDAEAIVQQAVRFNKLAPNMIIKIPVTGAGLRAIEEATYRGISINATVSFTLAQSVAVAEAVERGLQRREREGKDISSMGPVCTLMVGRLDDWLKVVADEENITLDPGYLEWAGVAVFKKTYFLFQERGYRIRLLSAAFRNHMHWSQLIGGDLVITIPYPWQVRINASDIQVMPRIDDPVDPKLVNELLKRLADFQRAYFEDGLSVAEFESFGPARVCFRQFISATADLDSLVRDVMIPPGGQG